MKHRRKFAVALAIPVLLVAALYASLLLAPPLPHLHSHTAPHYLVPEADWGHVRAFDGMFMFLLGPASDQRRRYEVSFGRVVFQGAQVVVADDAHGKNAVPLEGKIEGSGCILHFSGVGVNVLIEVGKCVPAWAKDDTGRHAKQWIRAENLSPRPRVVLVEYQ